MDIRKLLEKDHRSVEKNFQALERAGFADDDRIEEIILALETHAEVEEQLFYPALEEAGIELVDEAREEHEEMKDLIAEIRSADKNGRADLLARLRDAVLHHVEEEEEEIFPAAGRTLGRERMMEIGEEAYDLRTELLAGGAVEEVEEEVEAEGEVVEVSGEDFREAAREVEHEKHPDEEPAPGP